ncbi:MAG: hypothetical protein JXA44_12070 [Methanospirillaceae archaeon]|nr:hypothetical protein [Methanospirillaceae archaeon]
MTRYPHANPVIKPPISPGTCFICKKKVTGDTIEDHLPECIPSANWPHHKESGYLIRIMDRDNRRFWLILLASPDATLADLDHLIRDVWVECCDHLSSFSIGICSFSSHREDEGMNIYIRDVLLPGEDGTYRYDYGSPTRLRISILSPTHYYPKDRQLVLLGQNTKAKHRCKICKADAAYAYKKRYDERTQYYCQKCLDLQLIDSDYCWYAGNSPRAGVCGCTKDDEDGIAWYPESVIRKQSISSSQRKKIERFDREDLYTSGLDPIDEIRKRLGISVPVPAKRDKPKKQGRGKLSPFPDTIPDSIADRHTKILDLCYSFCDTSRLPWMKQPVSDLLSLFCRIPMTTMVICRGTEEAWASGFIYAIGQMKGLFTRGREEGMKSKDVGDFFQVSGDTPKSRAYLIRTELRKVRSAWEEEYEGTLFDGQTRDDWAELLNDWVGHRQYRMRR